MRTVLDEMQFNYDAQHGVGAFAQVIIDRLRDLSTGSDQHRHCFCAMWETGHDEDYKVQHTDLCIFLRQSLGEWTPDNEAWRRVLEEQRLREKCTE